MTTAKFDKIVKSLGETDAEHTTRLNQWEAANAAAIGQVKTLDELGVKLSDDQRAALLGAAGDRPLRATLGATDLVYVQTYIETTLAAALAWADSWGVGKEARMAIIKAIGVARRERGTRTSAPRGEDGTPRGAKFLRPGSYLVKIGEHHPKLTKGAMLRMEVDGHSRIAIYGLGDAPDAPAVWDAAQWGTFNQLLCGNERNPKRDATLGAALGYIASRDTQLSAYAWLRKNVGIGTLTQFVSLGECSLADTDLLRREMWDVIPSAPTPTPTPTPMPAA